MKRLLALLFFPALCFGQITISPAPTTAGNLPGGPYAATSYVDSTSTRVIYVDAINGSDSTGAISIHSPFLTVGAAYTAAKAATPTSSSPIIIQIGEGTFAESAIAMDTQYISLSGVGIGLTRLTFSSGGITTSEANITLSNLSLIGTGSNAGPIFSSGTAAAGTSGGGQYKADVVLRGVEINNPTSAGQAMGGFFGSAYNCHIISASGIAVNLLWGGRLYDCNVTGSTYAVKNMINYWPQADPFGAHTGAGTADANNRYAMINGGYYRATATDAIVVHGLGETGVDWTATLSGESITNASTPCIPPMIIGAQLFGSQIGSNAGACVSGTAIVTGTQMWATTCVRDLHDCYIVGSYMNQFPNSGYIVQRCYSVTIQGCVLVGDASSQVVRYMGGNYSFDSTRFEGDGYLNLGTLLLDSAHNCTDVTHGVFGARKGTVAAPSISFRTRPDAGFYDDGSNFCWSIGGAYYGAFRTYGIEIGGTTSSPSMSLNVAPGGGMSGYFALCYNNASPFTIGDFATGTRYLSINASKDVVAEVGNVAISTAGKTVSVKSGTNALSGTFTLVAGTATVASTAIDANTTINVTLKTLGGIRTGNPDIVPTAGTGFVATELGGVTDTSTYNWTAIKVN